MTDDLRAVADQCGRVLEVRETLRQDRPHRLVVEAAGELEALHLQVGLHCDRAVLLLDGAEAVPLVEARLASLGAEADRGMPLLARAVEQRVHELSAETA